MQYIRLNRFNLSEIAGILLADSIDNDLLSVDENLLNQYAKHYRLTVRDCAAIRSQFEKKKSRLAKNLKR